MHNTNTSIVEIRQVEFHLLSPQVPTEGKTYNGICEITEDGNLKFVEALREKRTPTRNPHIYEGDALNACIRKDGSLGFTFKAIDRKTSMETLKKKVNADLKAIFERIS